LASWSRPASAIMDRGTVFTAATDTTAGTVTGMGTIITGTDCSGGL